MQTQTAEPGKGVAWYGDGWRLFMVNPIVWVVMTLIFMVIAFVLALIPVLGPLVMSLIVPALTGGLMYSAREAERDRPIEIGHLFIGLTDKDKRNPLLVLGAVLIVVSVLIALVVGISVGGSMGLFMMGAEEGPDAASMGAMGAGMLLSMLIFFVLGFLVFMAEVFAIPRVMFDDVPPVDALKESFQVSIQNIVPLLIFAVIYAVLAIIAMIPFSLGFLVLIPVAVAALYSAYREIYRGAVSEPATVAEEEPPSGE